MAQGFTKNGVKFTLDNEDLYHYEAFKYGNVDADELRKEYSRLRQVANKRLARMEGTRFEKSQTYLRNKGKFKTIAEIEKEAFANMKNSNPGAAQKVADAQIAKKMADLYKFLTAKTGSIRGIQQVENKTLETLRTRGFTFLNKDNIQQFGEYMDMMRILKGSRIYDSERAAELFGIALKKGVDPFEIAEDFEYWQHHSEELAKAPKIRNEQQRTSKEYRKRLENKKK